VVRDVKHLPSKEDWGKQPFRFNFCYSLLWVDRKCDYSSLIQTREWFCKSYAERNSTPCLRLHTSFWTECNISDKAPQIDFQ